MKNPICSERFSSVVVLLGVTALVLLVYILKRRKVKKLPPGPIGLPVFGYYPFLQKDLVSKLKQLAEKYGNVFGLYLGSQYVVFLNDWEAVKDGLGQNATLDKPPHLFEEVPYKFGFGGVNGAEWIETRRLASKVMKDALEKNQWEELLQEEMSEIVRRIKEERDLIDLCSFFRESFTNTVVSLLLGERLDDGNPITKMVSSSVDSILDSLSAIELSNFSPKLARCLQLLAMKEKPVDDTQEFYTYVSEIVDSRIHDSSSQMSDSFISRFQEAIDSSKKVKETTFATVNNLKGTVIVLLLGGSETTRTSMIWTLIAMADHPDKQRKVHEELDRVIGKDGSVRWSDRSKVPYTLAALLESMRWKTTVPFPVMRMASQETHIQGYCIPKGAFIMTNNTLLHNDSRYWNSPDQFKPERFLSEDGKKVNMASESFNVFSYGKRNCPGKLLALMDMLQYFTALMQKFKVEPKEGDKVTYEEFLGLSYQARNVELRFIPR